MLISNKRNLLSVNAYLDPNFPEFNQNFVEKKNTESDWDTDCMD